jgi:hypothetical protein
MLYAEYLRSLYGEYFDSVIRSYDEEYSTETVANFFAKPGGN